MKREVREPWLSALLLHALVLESPSKMTKPFLTQPLIYLKLINMYDIEDDGDGDD